MGANHILHTYIQKEILPNLIFVENWASSSNRRHMFTGDITGQIGCQKRELAKNCFFLNGNVYNSYFIFLAFYDYTYFVHALIGTSDQGP